MVKVAKKSWWSNYTFYHESSAKKIRSLEKGLMKVLLDPLDSDQRRRYVKRWLYGEATSTKKQKSLRQRINEVLSN